MVFIDRTADRGTRSITEAKLRGMDDIYRHRDNRLRTVEGHSCFGRKKGQSLADFVK